MRCRREFGRVRITYPSNPGTAIALADNYFRNNCNAYFICIKSSGEKEQWTGTKLFHFIVDCEVCAVLAPPEPNFFKSICANYL
jgi:hypothetical protein